MNECALWIASYPGLSQFFNVARFRFSACNIERPGYIQENTVLLVHTHCIHICQLLNACTLTLSDHLKDCTVTSHLVRSICRRTEYSFVKSAFICSSWAHCSSLRGLDTSPGVTWPLGHRPTCSRVCRDHYNDVVLQLGIESWLVFTIWNSLSDTINAMMHM